MWNQGLDSFIKSSYGNITLFISNSQEANYTSYGTSLFESVKCTYIIKGFLLKAWKSFVAKVLHSKTKWGGLLRQFLAMFNGVTNSDEYRPTDETKQSNSWRLLSTGSFLGAKPSLEITYFTYTHTHTHTHTHTLSISLKHTLTLSFLIVYFRYVFGQCRLF